MVFLIFTRANLYLGVNGRITELLMFGEKPFLSLEGYTFPDDLGDVVDQVHKVVETYFDSTAFGIPSDIELAVVYSEGVKNEIKAEIQNHFSSVLPQAWIWKNGIYHQTDFLDSESGENLPISFRRLIKSLKIDISSQRQLSWDKGKSKNVQVLEKLTKQSTQDSISLTLSNAFIATSKESSATTNQNHKTNLGILSILKRKYTSVSHEPNHKYLITIYGMIIVIALGALAWPYNRTGGSSQDEAEIINTSPKSLDEEDFAAIDSNEWAEANVRKYGTIDSNQILLPSFSGYERFEIGNNNDLFDPNKSEVSNLKDLNVTQKFKNQLNNRTDRSAKQQKPKTVATEQNEVVSNELVAIDHGATRSIGIKTRNTETSTDASSSSLSLSDYALQSQSASFPGGEGGMIRFLALNIRYPKAAKRKKITGNVVVRFDVDVEGNAINPTIVKGLGYGCDQEAIRIVENMPPWKPATYLRKRISSTHTVSIPFN